MVRRITYDPVNFEGKLISQRRILRSLLKKIRAFQDDKTYEHAKRIFDRMDELDAEYEKLYTESLACNTALQRLLNYPGIEQEHGSIFEEENDDADEGRDRE